MSSSRKNDVLKALMETDKALSGERLARRLNVSRNTIWKAIQQLREEGFIISAVTNRGYRLEVQPDVLMDSEIEQWLHTEQFGRRMEIHATLDSTNTLARKRAVEGVPHGYLVCADEQTGGRGRFGRTFFSPGHSGIYISYVLRPTLPAQRAVMITSMAAVAVARAIESVADVDVKIKWVNDLYVNGRKVCGILCEACMDFESTHLEGLVLGIGVNVGRIDFPPELTEIATSLENECGKHISRGRLIAEISNQLEALYGDLETAAFMTENRERSNVIGRDVTVLRGDERFKAHALDIDPRGQLVLRTERGIETLGAGEISLKLNKEQEV